MRRWLRITVLLLATLPLPLPAEDGAGWRRAILIDRIGIIEQALLNGQDVNQPTASGKTALMSAVKVGNLALAERLIDAGADVNATNAKGGTVLMYAMLSGDVAVVNRILRAGATLNDLTTTGWSALMIASAKDYSALVGVLLKRGGDANQQDIYGWTPLIRAAHEGHENTVERLLASEAINVSITDEGGLSALHHAALFGHGRIVSALLDAGADPALRDAEGQSARQLATRAGHPQVARLLEDHTDR